VHPLKTRPILHHILDLNTSKFLANRQTQRWIRRVALLTADHGKIDAGDERNLFDNLGPKKEAVSSDIALNQGCIFPVPATACSALFDNDSQKGRESEEQLHFLFGLFLVVRPAKRGAENVSMSHFRVKNPFPNYHYDCPRHMMNP
jgi:hypothetical protein